MEESMTYQKMVADGKAEGLVEGRLEGMRSMFLRLACRRLGEPNAETIAVIQVAPSEKIEQWTDRLFDAEDWSELLKD